MKTVAEIYNVLPHLTTKELQQIEGKLIAIYRARKQGIIFDDAYGVLTEVEHMAAIGETMVAMENSCSTSPRPSPHLARPPLPNAEREQSFPRLGKRTKRKK